MAQKPKSGKRIEPSFEAGRSRKSEGDMRADPSDRVGRTGSKSSRSAKSAKTAKSAVRVKKPSRHGGGLFGFVRFMAYWSVVIGLWGALGVAGIVVYYGARMPSANTWALPDRPPNIKIVDVNGNILANRGSTGGEAIALDDMSPYIPQAVMAIEDRRFYSHFGVDPIGLARAMSRNVLAGRMVQGGSTITQQLAKNMFLSPERTLERKVQEVLLAVWLEHKYSKDEILAMYLNRVFFGSNSYGVEAASRRYYNKSARDVNLAEAATLAGLLKAPSALSPARNPKGAEARAQLVMEAMRQEGYVTDKEITTAMSQTPAKAKRFWSGGQYYVADMVMDQLPNLIGDIKEDLVVDTTIDRTLEKLADKAISSTLDKEGGKLGVSQAALVAVDGTGAIRALVGGRDYAKSQFDRAIKAKRQPGSAFKPFVYAAALESGLTPQSVRNDAPVKIGKWTPENYDNKYRGEVSLANALADSLNTIAAQLVMEVGPDNVAKLAHRMGIESELQANASIALGTSEVSLAELTSAYAPFMNGGYKATPHVIRRISTASGKVLYENTYDSPPRVLSQSIVGNMNAMLTRVITRGTGRNAKLPGWQVAGKTGTTQSFRDALFVGYSSNLTTGVWFGNDDGTSMKKVTGGGLPSKAWSKFMIGAHEGLTPAPLFGIGGQGADMPVAANDDPAATRTDTHRTTLFDLISNALGGSDETAPVPAKQAGKKSTQAAKGQTPRARIGDPVDEMPRPVAEMGSSEQDGGSSGIVPPMDIGTTGSTRRNRPDTTLLDIINGQ